MQPGFGELFATDGPHPTTVAGGIKQGLPLQLPQCSRQSAGFHSSLAS
ncbi:MAG: hypothetical protein H7Z75_11870 [Ferruginibacter sp.]|nr:hypothetical protein [Cytophagales bacterium]